MLNHKEYKSIVYNIIGAAMEVHRCLGWGLQEHVYLEAMQLELSERGIACEREKGQGDSKGASEKSRYCGFGRGLSGLHCFWCNGRGPHLEWSQEPQGSSPFRTPIAGSLQSWDRRVRPRLEWRNGTLLASRVVHGMTGLLSSCVWNLRLLPNDARECQ